MAIAEDLGLDINTAKRIISELVGQGYATSVLGMQFFMITEQGRQYLQKQIMKEQENNPSININVGDNSNVQVQHRTENSNQTITNSKSDKEELSKLINEIKAGYQVLQANLSSDNFETLRADVEYLEIQIARPSPNSNVLKSVGKTVVEILKAVPANIIANVITGQLPTF